MSQSIKIVEKEIKICLLNSKHILLLSKTKKLLRNISKQNGRKEIHQAPSRIQDVDFVKALMRTLFTS